MIRNSAVLAAVGVALQRTVNCGPASKSLPEATPIVAVPVAESADSRALGTSDVRMIIRDEVHEETRRWLTQTANSEIRARIHIVADEEVDSARRKMRDLAAKELQRQAVHEVNKVLGDSAMMAGILEKHQREIEVTVEEKARAVLDRLCDEQKYGEIDSALHRALTRKVEAEIRLGLSALAVLNLTCLGLIGATLLMKR